MARFFVCIIVFMLNAQPLHCDIFTVEVIGMGIVYPANLVALPLTGPAMDIGLEEIQKLYSKQFTVKKTLLVDSSYYDCEPQNRFDFMVADYYYRQRTPANLTVFAFPGCLEDSVAVANLAAGWQELVLVGVRTQPEWRDKSVYPNVIQTGPVVPGPLMAAMMSVFQQFNWTTIYIVGDSGGSAGPFAQAVSSGLAKTLRSTPGMIVLLSQLDTTKNDTFAATFGDIKKRTRVIMFFGHTDSLRNFMVMIRTMKLITLTSPLIQIVAHQYNMTNGEYVFVTLAPFEYPTLLYGNVTWQKNDSQDEIALKAFQSVFLITPLLPDMDAQTKRNALFPQLIRRSKEQYNYTYQSGDLPSPAILAQYACMHMLGLIVNESLTDCKSDGFAHGSAGLAKRFWNRTIHTPVGPFSFDEVGERKTQFGVQQINITTRHFETFLIQDPTTTRLSAVKPVEWFGRDLPHDIRDCFTLGHAGPCDTIAEDARQSTITTVCSVVGGMVAVLAVGFIVTRKLVSEAQLWSIKFELDEPVAFVKTIAEWKDPITHEVAHYKEHLVSATVCSLFDQQKPRYSLRSREFLMCMKTTLEVSHRNIVRFLGIELVNLAVVFVYDYCQRGTLKRFLTSPPTSVDWDLKTCLAVDLVKAVKYLNGSIALRYHGLISCSTCMIDNHFNLKIIDFTVPSMMRSGFHLDCFTKCDFYDQFHIAREILAVKDFGKAPPKSSVYSTGTVILEILSEKVLEKSSLTFISAGDASLAAQPKNPKLWKAVWECIDEDPSKRPNIAKLLQLFQAGSGKRTVVEKVIKRLSKHAINLEDAVASRTQDLLTERHKCDALLQHMLPTSIVEKLRRHEPILPETFDSVTLQFSDIIGFADFVNQRRPLDVVDFLNTSHGLFDHAITGFDVYKVETITDSYFIASGLPKRNGDKHAAEMCRVALRLMLTFTDNFVISGMQLRIGIHTGPCVATVVGLQRPRYCLFGDTVNTTSRMETHGEASKVHLSSSTVALLKETADDLQYILRGTIQIKGKGLMETFWLVA